MLFKVRMLELQAYQVLIISVLLSTCNSYRLPTIYNPRNYNISLKFPHEIFTMENYTRYTGTVNITLTVTQDTAEIVLHSSASYINVSSAILTNAKTSATITDFSVNSTTDLLTLTLRDEAFLVENEIYWLVLEFDGDVSTSDSRGAYKSSYKDSSKATHYLVTTQMQATYARRAFPCFDEPRYKATFDISLTYPSRYGALSNMESAFTSTTEGDSEVNTIFYQTPKMSTYLVAFIISDLSCSSGNSIEGSLQYQVCSRNEASDTRTWALEVAPLAVDRLNAYLSINYSNWMSKLHHVAIPDLASEAMENWGMITYRESVFLNDDKNTSNAQKQYMAGEIAHELAHQWFGNLVTCKWWSETFLNEGFATLLSFSITHQLYPDMEMDNQFVIGILQYALEEDITDSEPLRSNVTSPAEILGRFDTISYEKGASVLRMVEHIVGTEAWKAGLSAYLNAYAFSFTEPDDLWNILGGNLTNLPDDVNLTTIMDSWINHAGFPMVNVSLNRSELTFTQQRYVLHGSAESNTTWYIPITYTTSEDTAMFHSTTPVAWISPGKSLTLTVNADIYWILVNNLQTGYYRVNYDSNLWANLASALAASNFSNIPDVNRAQIVSDAFSMARSGYISYGQLFHVIEFLVNETSYIVWYPALNGFDYLMKRFRLETILGEAIAIHLLRLASNVLDSVPISCPNSTNHIYTLKQVLIQSWACKLGVLNCTSNALTLFENFKHTSIRPDKNLRSIAYCYGLKHSTDLTSDWNFLWDAYLSTSVATEHVTILESLGCHNDVAILSSFLGKTLIDNSGIRAQDYPLVFASVYAGSSVGVDTALVFFTDHFNTILKRYPDAVSVASLLTDMADEITSKDQLQKLQKLIDGNNLDDTTLSYAKSALSMVETNFAWVNSYRSQLSSYYNGQS